MRRGAPSAREGSSAGASLLARGVRRILAGPAELRERPSRARQAHVILIAVLLGGSLSAILIDNLGRALQGNPDLVVGLLLLISLLGALLFALVYTLRSAVGWTLAWNVAIPLGSWRSAAYLAHHASTWAADPEGGAALAGALALLRRDAHDPTAAAELLRRISESTAIGTAGITATGLLTASRGDLDGARELLSSALTIEGKKALPLAKTCAREWLIADAARRGAWAQVVALGEEPWTTISLRARLLVAVAGRFVGAHSPTDTGLWLLWRICPGAARTRPLLDAARAIPQALHPRRFTAPSGDAPAPADVDALPKLPKAPLDRALVLHAHWIARDPLHLRLVPARLIALLEAWDAAEATGAIRRRATSRAATLGIPDRSAALTERFLAGVAEELAELAIRATVPISDHMDDPGELSERVIRSIRDRVLRGVEEDAERLAQRTDAKSELPAVDEWREWNQLRKRYELAGRLGGLDLRRLMFPQVHRDACSFAVWLWNERKEYGISTPIFRWLLAEAEAVGDEAAIDLQRRNLGVKAK